MTEGRATYGGVALAQNAPVQDETRRGRISDYGLADDARRANSNTLHDQVDLLENTLRNRRNGTPMPGETVITTTVPAHPSGSTEVTVETADGTQTASMPADPAVTPEGPQAETPPQQGVKRDVDAGRYAANFIKGITGWSIISPFVDDTLSIGEKALHAAKIVGVVGAVVAGTAVVVAGAQAAGLAFVTTALVTKCLIGVGIVRAFFGLGSSIKTYANYKEGKATAEEVEQSAETAGSSIFDILPLALGRLKIMKGAQAIAAKLTSKLDDTKRVFPEKDILKFVDDGMTKLDVLTTKAQTAARRGRTSVAEGFRDDAVDLKKGMERRVNQMRTTEMKEKIEGLDDKVKGVEAQVEAAKTAKKAKAAEKIRAELDEIRAYGDNIRSRRAEIQNANTADDLLSESGRIDGYLADARSKITASRATRGASRLQPAIEQTANEVRGVLDRKVDSYLRKVTTDVTAQKDKVFTAVNQAEGTEPIRLINSHINEAKKLEGTFDSDSVRTAIERLEELAREAVAKVGTLPTT